MSDKLMDTQELSEIRKLIGDVSDQPSKEPEAPVAKPDPVMQPQRSKVSQDSGEFNLNDILAEVSGAVDQAHEGHSASPRMQSSMRMPQGTARIPRVNAQRPVAAHRLDSARIAGHSPHSAHDRPGLSRNGPYSARYRPHPTGTGRILQGTGRVPQVSGRIPRVPGVDPRAVEESLRATADEQARHLAKLAAEEDNEPRLSRRERKRREKERRAENERALDREDDIEIRNPREAQRFCKRRAKNLARRSVFVLILGLLAMYITVASGMGLPLPAMLQYAEHAYLTIMTLMIMQFLAMFAGLDIVGNGIYNLFKLRPDRSTLVDFSLVASLIHGMTIILFQWSGWLPYCAVSILLLFAQMQEEKARMAGRYRAYKAATLGDRPIGVYAHQDSRDHVRPGC